MKRAPITCFAALLSCLAVACTAESWTCEACLRDDLKTCGSSGTIGKDTEALARCAAAESVCVDAFDQATFDRRCKEGMSTVQRECTAALLDQFELKCRSETRYVLPGGVK